MLPRKRPHGEYHKHHHDQKAHSNGHRVGDVKAPDDHDAGFGS